MNRLTDNARRRRPGRDRAFTLIELLVVLLIISILVALAVNIGRYVYDRANRTETRTTLEIVVDAMEAFRDEYGVCPPDVDGDSLAGGERLARCLTGLMDEDDLNALLADREAYMIETGNPLRPIHTADLDDENLVIKREVTPKLNTLPQEAFQDGRFRDAWGNAIGYDLGLGGIPVPVSPGPDGEFDTEDDITSDGAR